MLAAVALLAALWWVRSDRVATVRTVTAVERAAGGGGTVLNASGYVTARRRATISSKITGKLVENLVEEGLPVREGQVLARLDDVRFQANLALADSRLAAARSAVEECNVQLDLAELTLARTERLAADGVLGQADLDAAETEVDRLEARATLEEERVGVALREVALRRTELEDTVIRAPFDGIVISKDAQPGEMVSPVSAGGGFIRTGICTVVDMSSLEIEVDVNESYISRVQADQEVEAILDAYPDWRIPARVITTIPAADRQKATVMVRIGFDELDPRILPDMGVKVAFREAEAAGADRSSAGLFVPRAAVRREDGRDVIYLVRDGRAERRAVRLGAGSADEIEVVAGLGAGEQVVVEGPEDLSDGQAVATR